MWTFACVTLKLDKEMTFCFEINIEENFIVSCDEMQAGSNMQCVRRGWEKYGGTDWFVPFPQDDGLKYWLQASLVRYLSDGLESHRINAPAA